MVLGDRMVSAVGAIGVIEKGEPTARKRAEVGDVILMTEGSGGGTISTTALYYGMFDVINETINVDFLKSCKSLIENDLLKHIHVMTDVTNGGLRGVITSYSIHYTKLYEIIKYPELYNGLNINRVIYPLESAAKDVVNEIEKSKLRRKLMELREIANNAKNSFNEYYKSEA